MELRVDDIVISEKNAYIVSDNKQMYSDIETASDDYDVYTNAWNLSLSDGSILHNIFDSSKVDIQSQIQKRITKNTSESKLEHLNMFMPSNNTTSVGMTQLYDTAFGLSGRTTEKIHSNVIYNSSTKETTLFEDSCAICKYDSINDLVKNTKTYITPTREFEIKDGIQYLTEYPFNDVYNKFTDNISDSEHAIVYGDSLPVKYYLDETYSMHSTDTVINGDTSVTFKRFRTYYNIDSTGNSIYLVYKNDKNGTNSYTNNTNESVNKPNIISLIPSKTVVLDNMVIGVAAIKEESNTTIEDSNITIEDSNITTEDSDTTKEDSNVNTENSDTNTEESDTNTEGSETIKGDSEITTEKSDATTEEPITNTEYSKTTKENSDTTTEGSIYYSIYSSDSVSGIFTTMSIGNVNNYTVDGIYSPRNNSFVVVLYKHATEDNKYRLFYIPKAGGVELAKELTDLYNFSTVSRDNIVISVLYDSILVTILNTSFIRIIQNIDRENNIQNNFITPKIGNKENNVLISSDIEDKDKDKATTHHINISEINVLEDKNVITLKCNLTDKNEHFLLLSKSSSSLGHYFSLIKSSKYTIPQKKSDNIISLTTTTIERSKNGETTNTTKTVYNSNVSDKNISYKIDEKIDSTNELKTTTKITETVTKEDDNVSDNKIHFDEVDIYKDVENITFIKCDIISLKNDYAFQISGDYLISEYKDINNNQEVSILNLNDITTIDTIIITRKLTIDYYQSEKANYVLSNFTFVTIPPFIKSNINDYIDYIGENKADTHIDVDGGLLYNNSLNNNHNTLFNVFPLADRNTIITNTINGKKLDFNLLDESSDKVGIYDFKIEHSNAKVIDVFHSEENDLSFSVVDWKDNYTNKTFYYNSDNINDKGYNLVFNGICLEVFTETNVKLTSETEKHFETTIHTYPHISYGDMATAGTHLKILDGKINSYNKNNFIMVNGYFIYKNYDIKEISTVFPKSVIDDNKDIKLSDVPVSKFKSGGYIVTDYTKHYISTEKLYGSEELFSDNQTKKSDKTYTKLWHIKPSNYVEFYPASNDTEEWKPFYSGKYIDSIKYANGYYYISLRAKENIDENDTGYDIIETDSLFTEQPYSIIENGTYVENFEIRNNIVIVSYHKKSNDEKYSKWFECGNSKNKYDFTLESTISQSNIISSAIKLKKTSSSVASIYDNVESIYSINRFIPNNVHKTSLFSIKIDNLGIDDSTYLSDIQKKYVKTWITNNIINIVNDIKPAQTDLFNVYIN